MATQEQMEAAHAIRVTMCSNFPEELRQRGWDYLTPILKETFPFVVELHRDVRGWGEDNPLDTCVTNDITQWLDEHVGPRAVYRTRDRTYRYDWRAGAWDYFYLGDKIMLYFVDQDDALACRMRWG